MLVKHRGTNNMHTKTFMAVSVVLISTILFPGCPGNSSSPVGAWVFYIDSECDNAFVSAYMIVLYPGNQAEFFGFRVRSGTWNVVNSTLAVTFPDVDGSQYIFTAQLGTDVVTGGAFSIDGAPSGCVTGQIVTP
jgi:hypothetical protein